MEWGKVGLGEAAPVASLLSGCVHGVESGIKMLRDAERVVGHASDMLGHAKDTGSKRGVKEGQFTGHCGSGFVLHGFIASMESNMSVFGWAEDMLGHVSDMLGHAKDTGSKRGMGKVGFVEAAPVASLSVGAFTG